MPLWWSLLWIVLGAPATAPTVRLSEAEVGAALDEIVAEHLRTTGVPGVVVTVTQGQRAVLVRGWGLADLETDRPMDPESTLVRIASLSKTFTATAAAQLEDAGRLDLDADVNRYLRRRRVPEAFREPVTVRHLLAHTSGFINFNCGRVSQRAFAPEDFEDFIARTMPPQMHPPGTATLYTNHGNALAGLVIQDLVGVAFSDHVRASIFEPLGMRATRYYLDPSQPELARSYDVDDSGNARPWPYEHFGTIPASAVHTTARDMAPYLMLHAGNGTVAGNTVLSAAAMTKMRTPHATVHEALPEYHYAFAPTQILLRPARAHGGSVPAFLSRMAVFDEAGVGVFVAQNAFGPNVADKVLEAVAAMLPEPDRPQPPVPAGDGKPPRPEAVTGQLRPLDKHETAAFTRARAVLSQPQRTVGVDGEGFLVLDGQRFIRTGEHEYQAQRADGTIVNVVLVMDEDGRVAWVHEGHGSAFAVPWHGTRAVQLAVHAMALLLLLLGWGAARRTEGPPRRLWAALAAAALIGTIAPHVFAAIVDAGQPVYTHPLRFGIPGWIPVLLWLPTGAVVLGVGLLVRRELRVRAAAYVLTGGALLVALQMYWRTPPPGLPPIHAESARF